MNADDALALARSFKDLNDFQIAQNLLEIYFDARRKGVDQLAKELSI